MFPYPYQKDKAMYSTLFHYLAVACLAVFIAIHSAIYIPVLQIMVAIVAGMLGFDMVAVYDGLLVWTRL